MKKPVKRCLVCDEPVPTEDERCCAECEPTIEKQLKRWGEYEFTLRIHGGGWSIDEAWDDALKILNHKIHTSYLPPSDEYVYALEVIEGEEE